MKRNFGALYEELSIALEAAQEEVNPINRYLTCIRSAESAIDRMKEMVVADPFPGPAEEMHHFKHEAPELYSQLFYYLQLKEWEAGRPHSSPAAFADLLRKERARLDEYFVKHDHICRYYNQGFTHQDQYLFLRQPIGQWSGDEIGAFIPTEFTIGAYWISWIKANDRLRTWLREELMPPDEGGYRIEDAGVLPWTGSRAELIELFYALWLAGCFRKNRFKQVMKWVEVNFGVKAGQYHSSLNDMASRKEPASFLKRLLDVLKRKFDANLG